MNATGRPVSSRRRAHLCPSFARLSLPSHVAFSNGPSIALGTSVLSAVKLVVHQRAKFVVVVWVCAVDDELDDLVDRLHVPTHMVLPSLLHVRPLHPLIP